MQTKTYNGVAYRQSNAEGAPWLISFVATAEEILDWAGIPRRAETGVTGFQRPFDETRVERAREFFEMGTNQSPTSLIIGLHPPSTGIPPRVRLEFPDGEEGPIRNCSLSIDLPDEECSTEDLTNQLRTQITQRMESAGLGGNEPDPEEPEEDSGETESDADSEEDEATEDEIELGKSVLTGLKKRLEDKEWCSANREALFDLAKPATIIDGQHRILGAERCEREIPFNVCALFECPWHEQVFQFTVVNYTAKGIPDQFITANAALSLTETELRELEQRLVQAKVKVVEYELMKVLNYDKRSPFYNLVNLSEGKKSGLIGYKTMVQIAKGWYSAKSYFFKQILAALYPKSKKSQQLALWKQDDWGVFIVDFWTVVHKRFATTESHIEGETLWTVGSSNLTVAATLLQLQNAFFDNCNAQDEDVWHPPKEIKTGESRKSWMREKLKQRADRIISYFPSEFFASPWKLKSLNTGPGKVCLIDALTKIIEKKGKYQYEKSALFTGKTGA